ncbi:MAG: TrmB family transcriptional regulator [Microlunatus sp.]|nr:TrmB family transcriptional regulator [Microlunatus sp.]
MIERLTALGFSSQEARVYLALLQHPSATGYELAKHAGLQRANVYQVLAVLTDRHVVEQTSAGGPARFVAQPPSEVLGRIKRRTSEQADSLIADLAALGSSSEPAGFFSLRDRDAVIERTAALVGEAEHRVAISLWGEDLDWLSGPLRAASAAGCQVVVNVFGETELEVGEVFTHEEPADTVGGHLLHLAADQRTALIGSLDEPASAVFTQHPALVGIVEKLIRDETYLAAIYARFADDLEREFGRHLVRLRSRFLPPDQAEQLISIVGFGADEQVTELLA